MISQDRLVEVKSMPQQKGMVYNITSKSNPFDGYLIVSLGPLWAINEPELHKIVHSHSIRTNVLAAEITHFFPHGNPRTEEQILSYMRKGGRHISA
jgi:hypothetical protein